MKIKNTLLYICIVCVLPTISIDAQNHQKVKTKAPKTQRIGIKHSMNNALFTEMLPSTAKILFVDSVIVDKQDFFKHIPLDKVSGQFTKTSSFIPGVDEPNMVTFLNGLQDKAYVSKGDSIQSTIFYTDKIGGQWMKPTRIAAIDDTYLQANYPFMMQDGVTLYFAAKGNHSIGGYDLFMTRYNSEQHSFYNPENIGLPYNSPSNDYLLAIDEVHELGWLVTDRRMPEGKVCIYTFIPTKQRLSYEKDNLTAKQLEAQAQITSIASTWKNGNRELALKRLNDLISTHKIMRKEKTRLHFFVNDEVELNDITEFKPENQSRISNLLKLKTQVKQQETELENLRERYRNSSQTSKKELSKSIINGEKQLYDMQQKASNLEKEIRNIENLK